MIKNIFFDFNGTLLDDVFLTFDVENNLAKKYGVPPFSMEKYLDVFCFPVRDYYEKIGIKNLYIIRGTGKEKEGIT